MPQDRLEEFIVVHRKDFDDAIPSLKVWAEIDSHLDKVKPMRRRKAWMYTRIAAAVVFLLIAGGVIGNFITADKNQPVALSPELQEMEAFYSQQFQKKYAQLTSLYQDETIENDLSQVDVFLEELKQELATAPKGSEERIIENLIQSYQLKIQILDRVLERIQNDQTEEKIETDERKSISI
jgi:uncharacterized membrane-anchored protein YhcB (DUF1043 family)